MKVVFSGQAKAGLREIGLYIARDNKPRAISFVRELRTKAVQIGNAPRAFPLLPGHEQRGIRRRSYGNYLIFDRIEDNRIAILQILHAARDYETLLFPDS
jgi:plasmid stabilization system protein ParE